MADKKVKIQIDTAANTKGAQDASKALDKVNDSQKEVARSADAADNTIAGMKAEVARLTTELENTNIESQEFIQKATQLDAVQKRLGATLGTSGAGFKNVGSLIGQAGFQVQDFAVQVGAGTSALTALSQQGSQLLGVFGPGGAVAGALLAIGAIAAKVFVPAELEMGRFLENIEGVAKLAAEGISENFDNVLEGIQQQSARALELAAQYDGVKEASDRYSQSELDNAAKRSQALILINQLLGVQVDTMKELQAQQDAESAKRLLTTQQQIAAQNQITAKAQENIQINNDTFLRDSEALAALRARLALEQQKLELFRRQKAELEAQQRNAPSFLENASDFVFQNSTIAERRINADRAGATLGSGGPQLNVETSNARVNELESKIQELEKTLTGLATGLVGQAERAEITAANVETEIARIQEASRSDELLASVTNAQEQLTTGQTQVLTGLQELVTASQPITESQKQARDLVAQAIVDGQITAQEAALIAQQLPILMKTLNASNQLVLTNFGIVENNLRNYQTQLTDVQRRLTDLSRQAGKPTN
jgi:hypothetical protein